MYDVRERQANRLAAMSTGAATGCPYSKGRAMSEEIEPEPAECPDCGELYIAEWITLRGVDTVLLNGEKMPDSTAVFTFGPHDPCAGRESRE
jgi:hypothetical protein